MTLDSRVNASPRASMASKTVPSALARISECLRALTGWPSRARARCPAVRDHLGNARSRGARRIG